MAWVILIVVGVFLGAGENRKIVVFSNFNDLGLTFFIPGSLALILTANFFTFGEQYFIEALILGSTISLILTVMMIVRTFAANGYNPIKALLSIITKLPLSILWVLALLAVLDPGGKSRQERAKNRATGLVILTFLTPLILVLVADKKGSLFNPMKWIRGGRNYGM